MASDFRWSPEIPLVRLAGDEPRVPLVLNHPCHAKLIKQRFSIALRREEVKHHLGLEVVTFNRFDDLAH